MGGGTSVIILFIILHVFQDFSSYRRHLSSLEIQNWQGYFLMQSYRNSFDGDVISNSVDILHLGMKTTFLTIIKRKGCGKYCRS